MDVFMRLVNVLLFDQPFNQETITQKEETQWQIQVRPWQKKNNDADNLAFFFFFFLLEHIKL